MANRHNEKRLSDQELLMHSRHLLLSSMSEESVLTLKSSKVFVVGMGGLGCAATPYLASSGVGELVLVDREYVVGTGDPITKETLTDIVDDLDGKNLCVWSDSSMSRIGRGDDATHVRTMTLIVLGPRSLGCACVQEGPAAWRDVIL